MTSDVDGTLSCVRCFASVGPPGPGFTLARARSKRDLGALSKINSRFDGAEHHPAAEKRTPSTQAKAACRPTDRGRSVLRNTLGNGRNDRARCFRTSNHLWEHAQMFIMERAQVLVTLDHSQVTKLKLALASPGRVLPRKSDGTLRLPFFGIEAEPMPRRNLLQGDHGGDKLPDPMVRLSPPVDAASQPTICTANVLTLYPEEEDEGETWALSARRAALAKQTREVGVDILGVQEGRSRKDHFCYL